MLLDQKVKVKWSPRNIEYYKSKGYLYTKIFNEFEVNIKDISPGSKAIILVKCDFCGEIKEQMYKDYMQCKNKTLVDMDCCIECMPKKLELSMNKKYGVNNISELPETTLKRQQTTYERFGVYSIMHLEEVVDFVVTSNRISMYENGTAPCSKQQKYLHHLLGGELNYPISKYALDIAFPDEKIFVECDFSGHDLSVQMGNLTHEDFKTKEQRRSYYLRNLGWREIRIVSLKDKLPNNDMLLQMIKFAKEHLNKGHSWLKFDIDNNKVLSSQFSIDYDYGQLRLIKKSDLDVIAS